MPVVFESDSGAINTSFDAISQPLTHTLSTSSDRKLLFYIMREEDSPVRSVNSIDVGAGTANGVFVAKADAQAGSTFGEDTDLWYYDVGSGESGDLDYTINLDGASNNDAIIRVIELSSAVTGSPFTFDTDRLVAGSSSFTLTSCPDGSAAVYGVASDAGANSSGDYFDTPSGYTELSEGSTVPGSTGVGSRYTTGYKIISGTSTESFTVSALADTGKLQSGVAVCIEAVTSTATSANDEYYKTLLQGGII